MRSWAGPVERDRIVMPPGRGPRAPDKAPLTGLAFKPYIRQRPAVGLDRAAGSPPLGQPWKPMLIFWNWRGVSNALRLGGGKLTAHLVQHEVAQTEHPSSKQGRQTVIVNR